MRVHILGVGIDAIRADELERTVAAILDGPPKQRFVVTANPELLVAAERDPAVRRALEEAELVLADGVGLQWAAAYGRSPSRGVLASLIRFTFDAAYRRLGLPDRLPGVDLVRRLLALATIRGLRVILLHREDGRSSADEIRTAVARDHPRLRFSVVKVSPRATKLPASTTDQLQSERPDVLFADLGAPFQEKLLASIRRSLSTLRLCVGVGGSFDFLTGQSRRAPRLLRRAGFEWFWRLVLEPRRWNRILTATIRFIRSVRRYELAGVDARRATL